jgi:hypothetical protein
MILLLLIFIVSTIMANDKKTITGSVIDSDGKPIPYVNVFIKDTFTGSTTDEDGNFKFDGKLTENYILVVTMVGFKKEEIDLSKYLEKSKIELEIRLEREAVELEETIVVGSSFSTDKEKGVVVTSMDVMTTPGGAADVFQSLKTLPGITQVSESAELYIRGGDPIETVTLLDQATLNHPYTLESSYGGLFSNINTNSVKGMFFSSGGFTAKYGNALSGVLSLESKDGPEFPDYSLGLSMAAVEINSAFPLSNKTGIRFNGRQNYTGPIFWLNGGDDDFIVVPLSKDFNATLSHKYSQTGRIKLFGYFASDNEGVNVDLPGYTDQFDGQSNSGFINLQMSDIIFSNVVVKSSLSKSFYSNDWELGILDLTREDEGWKSRTDFEYVAGSKLKLLSGFEIENRNATYKGVIPKEDYDLREEGEGEILNAEFDVTRIGGYFEFEKSNVLGIDNFYAVAGIRGDFIDQLNLNWIDPRATLGYKLNDKSTISFGWGIFHQFPDPRLYSQTDGNPNLNSMRADHYIFSYSYKIKDEDNFRIEAYYKDYSDLPLEDYELFYNNNGYGYAKGIDILFKGNITKKLSGWLSYGFINTKRKWMDFEELSSSDYDITHNLTIVAKYDLLPNLQIGSNFKYATGKPFTPVVNSVYLPDSDVYEPIYGIDNSERYPDYVRLDLRVTLLHTLFDKWFSVFYVEALNILDVKNIFDYSYNFDYSERKDVRSYFGSRMLVFGAVINL